MKTLELCCGGRKYKPDSVGVDINLDSVADVIWNLEEVPWPFKNDEFEEVLCFHAFEHFQNRLTAMEEIHRVSKNGALLHISGPHFSSVTFYSDITHQFPFSWRMFDFILEESKIDRHYTNVRYRLITRRITFYKQQYFLLLPYFFRIFPKLWEKFFSFVFPARQVDFVLQVVK